MAKPNHTARIELLEAKIGEIKLSLGNMEANQAQFKETQDRMQASQEQTITMLEEMLRRNPSRRSEGSPVEPTRNEVNSSHTRFTAPRMDFPQFSHDSPRSWLRKCNKYFMINSMNDVDKVVMAGMYFEGAVES